jgi:hypothetical protein
MRAGLHSSFQWRVNAAGIHSAVVLVSAGIAEYAAPYKVEKECGYGGFQNSSQGISLY